MGKKKHPIYKVVAADMRSPRDGRFIEAIGQYDPNVNPILLDLKEARVMHWLSKGAQPTDTVRSLLSRKGIWLKWTLTKRRVDETKVQEIMQKWQMQQEEKGKREADRKARRAERKRKAAAATSETLTAEAPAATA